MNENKKICNMTFPCLEAGGALSGVVSSICNDHGDNRGTHDQVELWGLHAKQRNVGDAAVERGGYTGL